MIRINYVLSMDWVLPVYYLIESTITSLDFILSHFIDKKTERLGECSTQFKRTLINKDGVADFRIHVISSSPAFKSGRVHRDHLGTLLFIAPQPNSRESDS